MRNRKTLFFANLDPEIDTSWLANVLEPFGQGYNIRIIPPKSKEDSIYGFAEMTESDADELLAFFRTHDLLFWGRKISVKEAKGAISPRSHAIKEHICCKIREKQMKKEHRKQNRRDRDNECSLKE